MQLSKVYEDFDKETGSISAYLDTPATVARLKVEAEQVTLLQTGRADWKSNYAKYVDPLTHTPPVVMDTKTSYKEFRKFINALKKGIKNNPTVELTGDDYSALYIHKDAERRKAVPRPTIYPANTLVKQAYCSATIFTSNPNPPFEKETSLPKDVTKIGRKVAFTKKDEAAPDIKSYVTLEAIGATIWEWNYEADKIGLIGWVITYYLNNRGEAGPDSRPLSFTLS